MAAVELTSRVTFHPLSIRKSEDHPDTFVAGRIGSGQFVELPSEGIEAVRLLATGRTVGAVAEQLDDGSGPPDIIGLLTELVDLAWVASVDERRLPDPIGPLRAHLPWLRPGHVAWLFSIPTAVCLAALAGFAAVTVVRRPELLPSYQDYFWTGLTGVATLVNTLMFFAGGIVHELMHLAAARSLGLPARMGLGTRLIYLALQTDVSAAWSVPRRRRYRIYLAGMAWDATTICVGLLILGYLEPAAPARELIAAYLVIATLNITVQFQVYMRTDLFFVVMDLLRCGNLFHDGLAYVRFLSVRAVRAVRTRAAPPDPSRDLAAHERRAVRIFAPLVALGVSVALTAYVLFGIPILVQLTGRAVSALAGLASGGSVLLAVDGLLVLIVVWGLQVAFLVTFLRSHPVRFRRGTVTAKKEVK